MSSVQPRRRRLANLVAFLVLAVVLGAGIGTVAHLALSPGDGLPAAVADEATDTPTSAPAAGSGAVAPGVESDAIDWPDHGAAAIAVGDGEVISHSDEVLPMASITKLVTALMVLEERQLQVGDTGVEYHFIEMWVDSYDEYLARGESALKVPAGGVLTEYQLLQGMLIGSACNYADILVSEMWGDDDAFAVAAADFLSRHGLDGITIVEPTGIDPRNTATASALITLGRAAMAHPVIAEIVAIPEVKLPGAGLVENTNNLLGDAGVVGIKTGTLDGSSLLSAKDVRQGDGTVRVFAVVLSQPDDDARFVTSRALYASVERQLAR